MKVLILGGTAGGRALARALGAEAVLSLAGVTAAPLSAPDRVGGFGGAAGLADYLEMENFDALIDATHPFAAQISHNAAKAARATGLPLLRLQRPPWPIEPGWTEAPDLDAAAAMLPAGARVFLSVGSRSLGPFLARGDLWFLTRSIVAPGALPPQGKLILARPPFAVADEMRLMRAHRISHLVSKNAGGGATRAKLEAARALGVGTIMVKRPRLPGVLTVASVDEAVKWVKTIECDLRFRGKI